MLGLLCVLVILQIFHPRQVNTLSKRSLFEIDLSSVLSEEQLPHDIAPTSYLLDINPLPEDAYFKGRVTINLVWQEASNKIVLHADPDLVIYQTELVLTDNGSPTRTLKILRSERDPERSLYIIHLRKSLDAGSEGQLSMTFTGKLNTEEHQGLFLSTYQDSNNDETKYFVGSYFKPNFARKVFPSFDEPEYKVPFTISIVRANTMTSLSNMPLLRSEEVASDPAWIRDYFQESFPMTTYSVGILVSDFTSISVDGNSEIEKNFDAPIQIWGTPYILDAAQHFNETIFKTVNNVGDILGLPYPLPKLDYIFVPGLELSTWGLIFQSDPVVPQIVYNVVSQWIGNTVTPGLWNDEVINDGLVLYLTAYIMSQENKDETIFEQILQVLYSMTDEYFKAQDVFENSKLPKTVYTVKIAIVLRMLHYTLGEKTLKQGLQKFVTDTKFKTYSEIDLWNAITEQGHSEGTLQEQLSVNEIAESWTLASSLPVLTVKRNYRDNSATFSQHAFRKYLLDNQEDENEHNKWLTPIVLIKQNKLDFTNTAPVTWIKEDSVRLTQMGNRDNFLIVNPEEIGPFLVNYDERNWKLISNFLLKEEERNKIPTITRSKLLHDAFNLAFAGELSYKVPLDMLLFLRNEDEDFVWQRFFVAKEYIGQYLSESTVAYEKFLKFLRHWFLALYKRLDDNLSESLVQEYSPLKSSTTTNLCEIGHKPCMEEAKNSFDTWIESPESSNCGNMNLLLNMCYIFRWGTDEDFELGLEHLMDTAGNETSRLGENYIFKEIVGCVVKPWQVEKLLNISIFERVDDFVDSDIENIILKLSGNAVSYNTLFAFLVQNWDALKERFEDKEELWKILIKTATSNFKTQEGMDLVQNLYSERKDDFGSAESTIETSLEVIKKEVELSSVNYPVIEEWLDNYLKNNENDGNEDFYPYER